MSEGADGPTTEGSVSDDASEQDGDADDGGNDFNLPDIAVSLDMEVLQDMITLVQDTKLFKQAESILNENPLHF
eukprot:4750445-Karenia_brevis.AAC.1